MKIKGNDLIVSADGQALSASKSCTLEVSVSVDEVAGPEQGEYKEYIPDIKAWTVTTSHLVESALASDTKIKDMVNRVGKTYTLTFSVRGRSADKVSGKAICTKFKVTATRGNLLSGSFTWQGTGKLE